MAYVDDILALSPDHLWMLDGALTDSSGSLTGTATSFTTTGTAIVEDTTAAGQTAATAGRLVYATTAAIDGALDRKAVCGWLSIDSIQLPPKSIWRESVNTTNQYNITVWAGNNIMFEVVETGTAIQTFGDNILSPNREYHIFTRIEGTSFGNKVELFIDGVLQGSAETFGAASLGARTNAILGSSNSANTQVGAQTVLLNAPVNGTYAAWATFSGANAQLTTTQIREELFEKGALPGTTIASDTEVNMQAALDLLASTVRPDEPLNIRIEAVTGDGTLNLTSDNITHDSKASIHIQYMGTGTLNYINTNGANASIGSTPNGGTINFINPAQLTVSPLIAGSEVKIFDASTNDLVNGTESSGTSFVATISSSTVNVVIHKEDYEYIRNANIDMTSGDVFLPVSQVFDRNYF